MTLVLKNLKLLKLPTFIYCLFHIVQSSNADFNSNLPNNYVAPQPSISDPQDKNNTVGNKQESENKPKNNSKSSKQTDNPTNEDFTKHNSNAPVYFKGKSADGSRKSGILNLTGNVVLIQDDTTLTSDKAKLIGKAGTNSFSSSSMSIYKATAVGNVHILKKSTLNSPEIKASANEIEFLVPKRIMILKGKAKVWKGQEYINAEYIELNLNSGDINLKEPHGTIDPRNSTKINKKGSQTENSKNKVTK